MRKRVYDLLDHRMSGWVFASEDGPVVFPEYRDASASTTPRSTRRPSTTLPVSTHHHARLVKEHTMSDEEQRSRNQEDERHQKGGRAKPRGGKTREREGPLYGTTTDIGHSPSKRARHRRTRSARRRRGTGR